MNSLEKVEPVEPKPTLEYFVDADKRHNFVITTRGIKYQVTHKEFIPIQFFFSWAQGVLAPDLQDLMDGYQQIAYEVYSEGEKFEWPQKATWPNPDEDID